MTILCDEEHQANALDSISLDWNRIHMKSMISLLVTKKGMNWVQNVSSARSCDVKTRNHSKKNIFLSCLPLKFKVFGNNKEPNLQ
jgi:hypothetical protein